MNVFELKLWLSTYYVVLLHPFMLLYCPLLLSWDTIIIRIWNHYTSIIIYVNDNIISLWTYMVSNVIKWVAHLSLLVTPTHATTLLHNLGYLSFNTNAELILFVLVLAGVWTWTVCYNNHLCHAQNRKCFYGVWKGAKYWQIKS